MKLNNFTRLAFIIITLSCFTFAYVYGDVEPNNDFSTAETVQEGAVFGSLTVGDVDYYVFTPSGNTALEIIVRPNYELHLSIKIYDMNENIVAEAGTSHPDYISQINLDSVSPNPYYIVVDSPADEVGSYSIDIAEKQILSVLNIVVEDDSGNPIDSATVYSVSQPAEMMMLEDQTDSNGMVSFDGIIDGQYEFRAEKTGYINQTIGLLVKEGSEYQITFKLPVNPSYSNDQSSFRILDYSGYIILALILLLFAIGWMYVNK